MDIPKAENAARRLRENAKGFDADFTQRCIQAINSATRRNVQVSVVGVDYETRGRVRAKLEAKGYAISAGGCQRDGSWFTIEIPA